MLNNILIIGFGVVGKLEADILKLNKNIKITIADPKYSDNIEPIKKVRFDLAIVCVPTPSREGLCDTSLVEQVIREYNAALFLIKSTVIPGTTDMLQLKYGKAIVMSPEHSGATQHCNNFEYNTTILGGDITNTSKIQQLYQTIFDARHRFIHTSAKVAELSKYMLNSYLALKVTFCNEFAKMCAKEEVAYEQVRECFISDPRINPAHTFVYEDAPFWNSHCFNKDVPAIANAYDSELLKTVIKINDNAKNQAL